MSTGRVIWIVEYNKAKQCWEGKRRSPGKRNAFVPYVARVAKSACVKRAAEMCEIELREHGTLSELRIRNKSDGKFRNPRTYGADPKRSRG